MQRSEPSIPRHTPFGDIPGPRRVRQAPFDAPRQVRTADVVPKRPPYEIFSLQTALDRPRLASALPAARAEPGRYAAMERLSWTLVRLAVCGLAGRLVARTRRRVHANRVSPAAIVRGFSRRR